MLRKTLLLLLILAQGCSTYMLYKNQKEKTFSGKLDPKNIHLVAFFINKGLNWYGEANRYYAKFHNIEPVAELFVKEALTRLGIRLTGRINFVLEARNNKLEVPVLNDYAKTEESLLLKRLVDYYPLLNKVGNKTSTFLIIEQNFQVILAAKDNRATDLGLNIYLMNNDAEVLFCRKLRDVQPLSIDDYKILVSFQRYNKTAIQKRSMELYSESFIRLIPQLLTLLRNLYI